MAAGAAVRVGRPLRAPAHAAPVALAAALALAYLLVDPPSADLAAQRYRTGLGLALWDNGWFAGHHLPGYGVLFPPLAQAIGPRVVGALAAVAASAAFAALAREHWGRAGDVAALWFAAGSVTSLISGRLTFALGTALALGAVLAAARRRRAAAGALALLTPLASPVAALFLALAGATWALAAGGRQRAWRSAAPGLALAAAALAPAVAVALAFPGGGDEPFVPSAYWPRMLLLAGVLVVLPARERLLRTGVALYALALTASFVLSTPVGGNATRLGGLVAGPLLAGAVLAAGGRRRAVALALLVVPAVSWQWAAAERDWRRAAGDPAVEAAYHEPVIRWLRDHAAVRVHVPMTADHWEAAHIAPHVPIARGWERQQDRHVASLFYEEGLTGGRLVRWLRERAVTHVAIPDAPLDPSSEREVALVRAGIPELPEVGRTGHWRVHAVRGTAPLADGIARGARLDGDGVRFAAAGPGAALVRVRFTRYWGLVRGSGCVERGAGGWTLVRARSAGAVELRPRFSLDRLVGAGPRCTG